MDAGRRTWPVLGLLMVAVLVPTGCLVWFMTEAMRTERLAVRQRLVEAYQPRLQDLANRVAEDWNRRLEAVTDADGTPAGLFRKLVSDGTVDALIVYNADGKLLYPVEPKSLPDDEAAPPRSMGGRRTAGV